MATLEALLVVPTPAAPAPPPPSPPAARLESSALQIRSDDRRPASDPIEQQRRLFAVELSLETGVRGGDGQTSASLGASSFLDIASWLAGFTARLDRYGSGAAGENQDAPTAATLGALVGRRFRFKHLMFDAAAGPALAFRGNWSVAMAPSATNMSPGAPTSSHNGLLPRGLLSGRLTLGARSTVRTFIGIEGELGATGRLPQARCGACRCGPPAPSWASRWGRCDRPPPAERTSEHRSGPPSDAALMSRLAGGESGALGELYDCHQAMVRRFLARATADAADVDDLLHATFLAAAKSAPRYDGRQSCRPWLLGIAAKHVKRRHRAFGRLIAMLTSLAGARTNSLDPRASLDSRPDVQRALSLLSEAKRVTFLLAELEGLSCPEIASALDIPVGTVWTRLHAARRPSSGRP